MIRMSSLYMIIVIILIIFKIKNVNNILLYICLCSAHLCQPAGIPTDNDTELPAEFNDIIFVMILKF